MVALWTGPRPRPRAAWRRGAQVGWTWTAISSFLVFFFFSLAATSCPCQRLETLQLLRLLCFLSASPAFLFLSSHLTMFRLPKQMAVE
ncbi:hypothetical protein V8C44DRAFT_140542 [Trichoderma aethiopicum]